MQSLAIPRGTDSCSDQGEPVSSSYLISSIGESRGPQSVWTSSMSSIWELFEMHSLRPTPDLLNQKKKNSLFVLALQ